MWNFQKITSSIFKRREVYVDNLIFRCFYRGSFWILIMGSMLLSLKQYFGEHIHCIAHAGLKNVINTYCFFSTTFTVVKHHTSNIVPYRGVGPVEDDDEVIHHAYYQWVAFFLFGQAICFYIPHWIWKLLEGKRLAKWIEKSIPKEFVQQRLSIYRDWGQWLIFCESLNLINLIFQVYITDVFLKGRFLDIGFYTEDLEIVFPKVTKCTWRQYGKSGTIQKHDALCVIALNVINEKIFIILWYWYILLAFLSLGGFFWRILTFLFHRNASFNSLLFSTFSSGPNLKTTHIEKISQISNFSEWLFVYYLCRNMKLKDYSNLIAGLGSQNQNNFRKTSNRLYPELDKIDKSDVVIANGSSTSLAERSKIIEEHEESDC